MTAAAVSRRLLRLAALALASMPPTAAAQPQACAAINDDAARLACYDRLFRRASPPAPSTPPSPSPREASQPPHWSAAPPES